MYKKYDDEIKKAVMVSGDLKLAVELGVPKSTAHYWINNAKRKERLSSQDLQSVYERKIKELEAQLRWEKDRMDFLKSVGEKVYLLKKKRVKLNYQTRKFVVNRIRDFLGKFQLKELLTLIGLSESRYRRWLSEIKICCITKKSECAKRRPGELTGDEIAEILKVAKSKKFSHYPDSTLHKKSLREGWANCCFDTWKKYLKLYGVQRKTKVPKKRFKDGVRAERPNQLWHIDLTQFRLKGGEVVYLQAIIDNYSRYIVDWQVNNSKVAANTIEIVTRAQRHVREQEVRLLTDKGSENNCIEKYSFGGVIKRVIAKAEIQYSNSMIEAFFRSLKKNFCHQKTFRTIEDVKRSIAFYVREHNEKMPHSAFKFETPDEVYFEKWSREKQDAIKTRIKQVRIDRRLRNLEFNGCQSCQV